MRGLLSLLVLAVIVGGIFFVGSFRPADADESLLKVAEEVALTVHIDRPARGSITQLVQCPGDVEAVREVEISSEIVSKIVEMPVEEGDRVEKGDLLARLDDKDILADIESADARIAALKATIDQAQADFEKAHRDVQRQTRLSEADATSELELRDYVTIKTKAEALLEIRRQELAQAQAGLKRIQEELARTIITSPIDGVIAKLNAKEGEVVVTGTMNNPGTVIMTISDLSRMQVRARIDEVDVPLVEAGQVARIYLQSDPDNPVAARVARVSAKGQKQTGRDVVTFEAMLDVLEHEARVKPGMTCNAEIEVATSADTLTVPIEAVVHRMRRDLPDEIVEQVDAKHEGAKLSERARQAQYIKVVYVMDGEKATVRVIEPGIADTRNVEVVEGVSPSDIIITGPYRSLDRLEQGTKIACAEDDKEKLAKWTGEKSGGAEEKASLASDRESEGSSAADEETPERTASAER